jgi:hypothetical protein
MRLSVPGSYHWVVKALDEARGFVTVDDLDRKACMSGSGRRTRAGCSLRSIPRSPARDRRCSRRQVRRRTISAAEPDQDQVVPAGCLKVENARVRVKAPRRAFLPLKTEGVAGAGELQPPLHRDTRPPIRRGWVSASQGTSPSPGRRLDPWQEWQGSAFVWVRSRSLALTEPCKQLFGANGCEQERTAARSCHAEGRGFESHHPLLRREVRWRWARFFWASTSVGQGI